MKKSYNWTLPIQEFIDYKVTNWLGYDSKTNFIDGREKELNKIERAHISLSSITEEEVKNSNKGLKAHLFEMEARVKLPFLEACHDYFSRKKGIWNFIQKKRCQGSINYYKSGVRDKKESAIILTSLNKDFPLGFVKNKMIYLAYLNNCVSSKDLNFFYMALSNKE